MFDIVGVVKWWCVEVDVIGCVYDGMKFLWLFEIKRWGFNKIGYIFSLNLILEMIFRVDNFKDLRKFILKNIDICKEVDYIVFIVFWVINKESDVLCIWD